MGEEDLGYEIMPYKEIVELKKQIADLQQKAGDPNSKDLLVSMGNLTKTMDSMLKLFSAAADEMKLEEKTETELGAKISPMMEKIERLEDQTKTIAEGLVAIADMVRGMKGEISKEPEITHDAQAKSPLDEMPPDFPKFDEEMSSLDHSGGHEGMPQAQDPFELPPLEPLMQAAPSGGPPPTEWPRPGFSPMPPPMNAPSRGQMQPPINFPQGPQGFGPLPPLPPLPSFEEAPKKGLFGFLKR
ncbi:hypothetical protein HYU14_06050 [Candidatus Woesearchaeota archaeon]|nr:hypothetical protein [Candidatus Woesearchaeota archaeon]